jgi:hypothetical protein
MPRNGSYLPAVVALLLPVSLILIGSASGCTVVLVGRNATADGSVIIAHTDDSGSGTCDLRLVKVRIPAAVTAQAHPPPLPPSFTLAFSWERLTKYKLLHPVLRFLLPSIRQTPSAPCTTSTAVRTQNRRTYKIFPYDKRPKPFLSRATISDTKSV